MSARAETRTDRTLNTRSGDVPIHWKCVPDDIVCGRTFAAGQEGDSARVLSRVTPADESSAFHETPADEVKWATISAIMAGKLPSHVAGLLEYLSQRHESANRDLALAYFRHVYPGDGQARSKFVCESEAKGADGYVPGSLILELKGESKDWHGALFQALAYGRWLDFSAVVVAAEGFLAVWMIDKLPADIVEAARTEPGAPSEVGPRLARRFGPKKLEHRALAWIFPAELLPKADDGDQRPMYADERRALAAVRQFEEILRKGRRVRIRITPRNLPDVIRGMVPFFAQPLAAVRAFYNIMLSWTPQSAFEVSPRHHDHATVGGETITGLKSERRLAFKDYVENYEVREPAESLDAFFARYDSALDAADPEFRMRNGIFFTDLDLSKFALWLVKREVPNLGKNYLVIDPACGSGNLVTNWRTPLELRHKVISEIEPDLLFAVRRRMELDAWHTGRFTVVCEDKGLNFLNVSAKDYLATLTKFLREHNQKPTRPLAFLCNPPFRSDDDQTASAADYTVDPSIVDITGEDAEKERYACFLAQMKLICAEAKQNGLPGDSMLLVFTKARWLTSAPSLQKIRKAMLGSFAFVGGVIVNSREFFEVRCS